VYLTPLLREFPLELDNVERKRETSNVANWSSENVDIFRRFNTIQWEFVTFVFKIRKQIREFYEIFKIRKHA